MIQSEELKVLRDEVESFVAETMQRNGNGFLCFRGLISRTAELFEIKKHVTGAFLYTDVMKRQLPEVIRLCIAQAAAFYLLIKSLAVQQNVVLC